MKTKKINFSISGGATNIGNISQGDKNTNISQLQSINPEIENAFSDFFSNLERLSSSIHSHNNQVAELRNEVTIIKETLAKKTTSKGTLVQQAKLLYEKYGWAVGILKKLFAIVIPG